MDKVDQWLLERWGKFTASECYKLLVGGRKGEMFGEGAMTYIEQKALEMTTSMWERPELEETKSILHGRAYEYPAYEAYIRETRNYSMTYMGSETPIFLPYDTLKDEAGGTPDCANISESGTIDFGAEFKCPKNPAYHFRRLKWKDQWDIKDNYTLCYTQIQMLLMITNAQERHFVSYDDRQKNKQFKAKIIPVKPDKKFQDNLDIRLRQAIKEKYKIISETYGTPVQDRADFIAKFHSTG
jgi:hypothetical protein